MLQSWHIALLLEPTFGFFLPAAHLLHLSELVNPVADEYRPSGHPIQALLATAPISVEYNPAGQSVVLLERIWNGKKEEQNKKDEKKKSVSIPSQFSKNKSIILQKIYDKPSQFAPPLAS